MQVRTPPLLAMAAAWLQALAPGREVLVGVGVSPPVVAGDWHGAGYPARPLARMRECLSGRPVTFAGDHYQVRGFRHQDLAGPVAGEPADPSGRSGRDAAGVRAIRVPAMASSE